MANEYRVTLEEIEALVDVDADVQVTVLLIEALIETGAVVGSLVATAPVIPFMA